MQTVRLPALELGWILELFWLPRDVNVYGGHQDQVSQACRNGNSKRDNADERAKFPCGQLRGRQSRLRQQCWSSRLDVYL